MALLRRVLLEAVGQRAGARRAVQSARLFLVPPQRGGADAAADGGGGLRDGPVAAGGRRVVVVVRVPASGGLWVDRRRAGVVQGAKDVRHWRGRGALLGHGAKARGPIGAQGRGLRARGGVVAVGSHLQLQLQLVDALPGSAQLGRQLLPHLLHLHTRVIRALLLLSGVCARRVPLRRQRLDLSSGCGGVVLCLPLLALGGFQAGVQLRARGARSVQLRAPRVQGLQGFGGRQLGLPPGLLSQQQLLLQELRQPMPRGVSLLYSQCGLSRQGRRAAGAGGSKALHAVQRLQGGIELRLAVAGGLVVRNSSIERLCARHWRGFGWRAGRGLDGGVKLAPALALRALRAHGRGGQHGGERFNAADDAMLLLGDHIQLLTWSKAASTAWALRCTDSGAIPCLLGEGVIAQRGSSQPMLFLEGVPPPHCASWAFSSAASGSRSGGWCMLSHASGTGMGPARIMPLSLQAS